MAAARDDGLVNPDAATDGSPAVDPLDAVNDPDELTAHGARIAPEVQNLNNAVRQATREMSSSQFDPNDLRPKARKLTAANLQTLLKNGLDAIGAPATDTTIDTLLDTTKRTLSKTQLVAFALNLQHSLPTVQQITINPRTSTILDIKNQLTVQLEGLPLAARTAAAKLLIDTVKTGTQLNRIRNIQLEIFLRHAVDIANNDAAELGIEGPGNWVVAPREKGMRVAPSAYQQQITGAMGGIVYQMTRVAVDENGGEVIKVRNFDGIRHGVLIDAKANYFRVFDPAYTTPGDPDYTEPSDWDRENNRRNLWQEYRGGRTAADNILQEANNQIRDAAGHPIVWVTQFEHQAQILQQLFLDHDLDITVRHEPAMAATPPSGPNATGPLNPQPSGPATSGTATEIPGSEPLTERTVPSRSLTTSDLTAHDHGGIAELRYLEQSIVDAHGGQRKHLTNELSALLTQLGLDASVDGPQHQSAGSGVLGGDVSPFARRLAGLPRDLVPMVILSNIGRDGSLLGQGYPSLRAHILRDLFRQDGSGTASERAGSGAKDALGRPAFFTRVLSPGGLAEAGNSAAFTDPLGGTTDVVEALASAVGEAPIGHDTERARAVRERQIAILINDARAALQASVTARAGQGQGRRIEPDVIPVEPIGPEADPHRIDLGPLPTRARTPHVDGLRITVDLDRLRVTITGSASERTAPPPRSPHPSAPAGVPEDTPDAAHRARAAADAISRDLRELVDPAVQSATQAARQAEATAEATGAVNAVRAREHAEAAAEMLRRAGSAARAARESADSVERLAAGDPAAAHRASVTTVTATRGFYRNARLALDHARRAQADARAVQVAAGSPEAASAGIEADRLIAHAAYDAHLERQHEKYAAALAQLDPGPSAEQAGNDATRPAAQRTASPAGENAIPTAIESAVRAAERLGAEAQSYVDGRVVLLIPHAPQIELALSEGTADSGGALGVTRIGQRISVVVDRRATMTDIGLEVVQGITAIIEHAHGAPHAERLLQPDTAPAPGARLTVADHQAIAGIRELLFLLSDASRHDRAEIETRLDRQIGRLGLDQATPYAAERRALLPAGLLDTLEGRQPDHASSVDGSR